MQRAAAMVLVLSGLGVVSCRTDRAAKTTARSPDLLAIEVARQSARARADKATDEVSVEVRKAALPIIEKEADALRDGRRLLAMHRLSFAKPNFDALVYVRQRTASRPMDMAALKEEWARMGRVLKDELGRPAPGSLDGVQPAAVRAIGEAALPQVRLFYDASLSYGENTQPEIGLFYLGVAAAERDLVAFFRRLAAPASGRPPSLRPLDQELDRLESELLAAYRPPLSIDRHPDFIAAGGALKVARELDAAGLRHGALLQYLQAATRTALLRAAGGAPDAKPIALQLRALESRIASDAGVDHSLGRLFLEIAEDDLETATAADGGPVKAAAIASEVMPRYFAALEPAAPRAAARPPARVTVTLVRWPFT